MKRIPELKSTYDGANIADLVEFARNAPVALPENGEYYLEKSGREAHIYEQRLGINQYNISPMPSGVHIQGINSTMQGIEIILSNGNALGGIEKIILHKSPKRGARPSQLTSSNYSSPSSYSCGESRSSGESRPSPSTGESRPSYSTGESRPSPSTGESRTSSIGESRSSGWGNSWSGGESRSSGGSGESRY
ncbi:hypothetical protein HOK51_01125 [Candidatus Woesearchaeota archaeon]|jgi:hypothetical protein|nr:hypothetical protein [Candidatus Woesearchaeota archaeon]MBT6518416.1 hypothetical protein [Candidatus Woesearchaeota archaeon]MBT7366566.1 hypothetical protein [Candidatus Woesearchaeota archaeon]